jgi:hypothetical protein
MINTQLYLQFDNNGNSIDHPMLFESAQIVVGLKLDQIPTNITEQDILQNNFALVENTTLHIDEHVIGEQGYNRLPNGNFTRNYITRTLTQEEKLDKWIRGKRDHGLYNCDWTQLPDNDLTDEEKVKWLAYRKYLRDMTKTYANISHPDEIIWPNPPLRRPLPTM